MLSKTSILTDKRIHELCERENIVYLGLFGSYSRGEETKDSDIDFLVKFSGNKSLFKIIKISKELSKIFGKKVDLVTENSLSKYIKKDVLKDIEVIYNVE
ncbi:type VII toxin-antitoxin system MntA family adenylyltransferase antitoxin [Methanococcus maripaludis]|nr:nucleotidyltransferase family protein [Methanococcus maripaludis]